MIRRYWLLSLGFVVALGLFVGLFVGVNSALAHDFMDSDFYDYYDTSNSNHWIRYPNSQLQVPRVHQHWSIGDSFVCPEAPATYTTAGDAWYSYITQDSRLTTTGFQYNTSEIEANHTVCFVLWFYGQLCYV